MSTRQPAAPAEPRRGYQSEVRQAKAEQTRARIRDAARDLLFDRPFSALTIEEIARAAGLARATVYQRYGDKTQIISEILADYMPKACAALATLPGPEPTLEQVRAWVGDIAVFVATEPVPLHIELEVRRNPGLGAKFAEVMSELLAGMGRNNPRFAAAAAADANPANRAEAMLLHQELSAACDLHATNRDNPCCAPMLDLVARHIHRYLSEPFSANAIIG